MHMDDTVAAKRPVSRSVHAAWLGVGLLALLLGVVRWCFPERPVDYVGPRAFLDAGFALGLVSLVMIVAGGLGRKVLCWLSVESLNGPERVLFGLPIGLGIVAYGVLALGLAGVLSHWTILAWLVAGGVLGAREWGEVISGLPSVFGRLPSIWGELRDWQKLLSCGVVVILAMSLVQALAPPWAYDALVYHLDGPRKFLESGRIGLDSQQYRSNYPLTLEMVYTVGLAFESDVFAKLVHLSYSILLVTGTGLLGCRYIGRTGGWIAGVVLLSTPILPMWSVLAYSDMGWATYELLAFYAFVLWMEHGGRNSLALSALGLGFALGSKYLALGLAAILGVWVLWEDRKRGLRQVFVDAVVFGGIALLVGCPWYLKNWALTGNPVYPAFFGGTGWTGERAEWYTAFHRSYGTGRTLWDFVLLPWSIYFRRDAFGTVGGSIEVPSPLFLLLLLYPLLHRSKLPGGTAWAALARVGAWFLGCQQPRLLLPAFPLFSVMTAAELTVLVAKSRTRRWWYLRPLVAGLVGGVMVATLLYAGVLFNKVHPFAVVAGAETKESFLSRNVADYDAVRYIQSNLPQDAKVMFMWDAQSYYCDERCWPDHDHGRWLRLAVQGDVQSVAQSLRNDGVTHLLFSIEDVGYVLLHDPQGGQSRALDFYVEEFRPACTREVFSTEWTHLVELTCP